MPTIKIYESLSDIKKNKILMIDYLKNELNENIYIFKLLQLTKFNKRKVKPIYETEITTMTFPDEWKFMFDSSSEIKKYKTDKNGVPQKNNFILFYLSSTLDALTRLNNLKDNNLNLSKEDLLIINKNIDFLYKLPIHSIIIADFEKELKTLPLNEILSINQ